MTYRIFFTLFVVTLMAACKRGDEPGSRPAGSEGKSSYGQAIEQAKEVDRLLSGRDYEKEAKELSEDADEGR